MFKLNLKLIFFNYYIKLLNNIFKKLYYNILNLNNFIFLGVKEKRIKFKFFIYNKFIF